jgi:hypothetical protein
MMLGGFLVMLRCLLMMLGSLVVMLQALCSLIFLSRFGGEKSEKLKQFA